MRYERRGEVPRKRHTALRENGTLLTEEVMGYEGFSGNESILYHLQEPVPSQGGGRVHADRAGGMGPRPRLAPDRYERHRPGGNLIRGRRR